MLMLLPPLPLVPMPLMLLLLQLLLSYIIVVDVVAVGTDDNSNNMISNSINKNNVFIILSIQKDNLFN